MDDLRPVLKKFVKAMAGLEIPYVVVGGFALAGWGWIRATRDVDVIIQLKDPDVPRFVSALRDAGFAIKAEDILDALNHKDHFSIFNADSIFHVDAKGVYGKKEAHTLESRVMVKLADFELPISGLEDTIANKLRFGREQDIEDALTLVINNWDVLKMEVLEGLCKEYGQLKLLRAIVKKAGRLEAERMPPDRHR
jgi:hypothetical protein